MHGTVRILHACWGLWGRTCWGHHHCACSMLTSNHHMHALTRCMHAFTRCMHTFTHQMQSWEIMATEHGSWQLVLDSTALAKILAIWGHLMSCRCLGMRAISYLPHARELTFELCLAWTALETQVASEMLLGFANQNSAMRRQCNAVQASTSNGPGALPYKDFPRGLNLQARCCWGVAGERQCNAVQDPGHGGDCWSPGDYSCADQGPPHLCQQMRCMLHEDGPAHTSDACHRQQLLHLRESCRCLKGSLCAASFERFMH